MKPLAGGSEGAEVTDMRGPVADGRAEGGTGRHSLSMERRRSWKKEPVTHPDAPEHRPHGQTARGKTGAARPEPEPEQQAALGTGLRPLWAGKWWASFHTR